MSANSLFEDLDADRDQLSLHLSVQDPELIAELSRYPEGGTREEFAVAAMKIGALAMRQASGTVDVQLVRQEGERLIVQIRELLVGQSKNTLDALSATLGHYFDPSSGEMHRRLDRMIRKDGELESLLQRHLASDSSMLAQTLAEHVGENSPVLKLLSPDQSTGILACLREVIEESLAVQRKRVLQQFSLDDPESALSRLVRDLSEDNGKLRQELASDLDKLCKEFSLDNEQGALCRLVARVELAQRTITDEFSQDNQNSALSRLVRILDRTRAKVDQSLSLDDESSALSRLRRELVGLFKGLEDSNLQFQTQIQATLEGLRSRRSEATRSTAHGVDFEGEVGTFLRHEANRLGDLYEQTGSMVGHLSHCKVGDFVLILSGEHVAEGSRIVCEAKADRSFSEPKAYEEIDKARRNRKAHVGIFVYSKRTAPDGVEPLFRRGHDLFVVWDPEDPASDIYLKGAYSIARALIAREAWASGQEALDLAQLEAIVERITLQSTRFGELHKWTQTIQKNSKKIMDRLAKIQDDLRKQVDLLSAQVAALREEAGGR